MLSTYLEYLHKTWRGMWNLYYDYHLLLACSLVCHYSDKLNPVYIIKVVLFTALGILMFDL